MCAGTLSYHGSKDILDRLGSRISMVSVGVPSNLVPIIRLLPALSA